MTPPLITLEEHFFSTSSPASLKASYSEQLKHVPNVYAKLTDLTGDPAGPRRRDMAAGRVALQVISHVPGLAGYDAAACRAANNELRAAVREEERRAGGTAREGRARFAGLAVAPMADPAAAAAELRRAVAELGFVGALVDNHARGRFYDGPEYDVWWAAAEELGAPVYLHPSWPSEEVAARYRGNFAEAAAASMASSGLGWHADTALHVMRLFASGLFDRRPALKIIIGHMGETIPFLLQRIQALSPRWGTFRRDFKTVYDENVWITTSGVWSVDPMRCILANTRVDRILYSVDYPFQKNEIGLAWIKELEESGLVNDEQLKAIAYGNAEKLLGVKAPVVGEEALN
ncbi:hypothetical protein MFIFM68171_07574 [Madurella fahalii]|uniref:Amidohydrolase-related domain-containing protein n=1 Tax=Madurella fahalii TaxID=1157608 RepID=A0ABQ0GHX3_9PEZI